MSDQKRLQIIAGTRPEVIKLAPVRMALTREIKSRNLNWKLEWISTGQHREMTRKLYEHFQFTPDHDLQIMKPNQTLTSILVSTLAGLSELNQGRKAELTIAQGDTTSAMATGIFSFQEQIPFAHVEAGLRTYDMQSPFPEEFNRRVLSLAARWNFAPTEGALQNLQREGIGNEKILVTGNTSIDALMWTCQNENLGSFPADFQKIVQTLQNKPFALVTLHRRENWGDGVESVLSAIAKLAENKEVNFLFPMHLNPTVRQPILEKLANHSNIILTEPLGYPEFCWAMKNARLIITDSGGVQEEAVSFATPMIITRENTERPETLATGLATLCGTDRECILNAFEKMWMSERKTGIQNPFGDGKASEIIAKKLVEALL